MGRPLCPESRCGFTPSRNIQCILRLLIVNVVLDDFGKNEGVKMQVLCKSTNGNAECRCCICGQGFVMFWERQSRAERMESLHDIQEALRRHHHNHAGPQAHPQGGFLVPQWHGDIACSGAAILGNAPVWDL